MTASALLTIVAVAYLMHLIGMSPSLGTFLAGILLADLLLAVVDPRITLAGTNA